MLQQPPAQQGPVDPGEVVGPAGARLFYGRDSGTQGDKYDLFFSQSDNPPYGSYLIGTEAQLVSEGRPERLYLELINANPQNGGTIWIGFNAQVTIGPPGTANRGVPLGPGASMNIDREELSSVYAISDVPDNDLAYVEGSAKN